MPSPELVKAQLIPYDGSTLQTHRQIEVQFNPSSLKIALSNQLKADTRPAPGAQKTVQYVDKSSSTLNVELMFDSTVAAPNIAAGSDVRLRTKAVAEAFMKPVEKNGKKLAPARLRFAWGAFAFDGMITTYNETLDFFSPEGTPLRATLALQLTEDDFQFTTNAARDAARTEPKFTPAAPASSVPEAQRNAGGDPKEWRNTALYNGIENPRFAVGAGASAGITGGIGVSAGVGVSGGTSLRVGLQVPPAPPPPSAAAGFQFGASASLGTSIDGAFTPGVSLRAGGRSL
ncbi:MAG TPA: hypothetical protein VFS67_36625 [Polyangiaceae bacterium]|nr:hypothetical protein [Polyangiaceae bacterium]